MSDMIVNSDILPEPLLSMVHTEKIRIRESGGVISILPVGEGSDRIAKVRGSCSDGKLTLDRFLEWKREEKKIES